MATKLSNMTSELMDLTRMKVATKDIESENMAQRIINCEHNLNTTIRNLEFTNSRIDIHN